MAQRQEPRKYQDEGSNPVCLFSQSFFQWSLFPLLDSEVFHMVQWYSDHRNFHLTISSLSEEVSCYNQQCCFFTHHYYSVGFAIEFSSIYTLPSYWSFQGYTTYNSLKSSPDENSSGAFSIS